MIGTKFLKSNIHSPFIDGDYLVHDEKDYSDLYSVLGNKNFLIYPAYTPKYAANGKALIIDKDTSMIVAKYSTNGCLLFEDKTLIENQVNIRKLSKDEMLSTVTFVMDFLKRIKVITSYSFDNVNSASSFISEDGFNATIRASRKDRFFMDKMIGNKSTSKVINVSKTIKIAKNFIGEQILLDFFHGFKIYFQPYADGVRFSIHLKSFKANAYAKEFNFESLVTVFKKMVKEYCSKNMHVDFELDYIYTDDFFDKYEILNDMIEY